MNKSKIRRYIAVIAAAFLLVACVVLPSYIRKRASAAEDVVTAYEEQNVWADLQGSVIAGEAFTVTDYPHNDSIDPSVITLVEFGFSWSAEKQADYGLYLYVYNPQDVAYDETRNRVQLQAGDLSTANYPLELLNYSNAPGYEGRFYKFKISLTAAQRRAILGSVSENARRYTVVSFELSRKNTVKSYTCAQTYTYSGYSLGYGSELAEESTLTCAVDGFEKYVELDVHQTTYCKEGDYYKGEESQLNSCYFRVPEKYFTDYGELTKMFLEWEEYVTQPFLVGPAAYDLFHAAHGRSLADYPINLDYLLMAYQEEDSHLLGSDRVETLNWSNVTYWQDSYTVDSVFPHVIVTPNATYNPNDKNFAGVFRGGSSELSEMYVSLEEVEREMLANSEYLGGPYYGSGYSQALFTDYVNPGHIRGHNEKWVYSDDITGVFSYDIQARTLWQYLFGGYTVNTPYDFCRAIVTSADEGFDSDLAFDVTDEEVSERFFIDLHDVPDFREEYRKAKLNGERLVLLRYAESIYTSYPSVLSTTEHAENSDVTLINDAVYKTFHRQFDSFVCFFTAYLDFDIISMWFTAEDGAETEIAVVMSPQDVFSGLNPPPNVDNDASDDLDRIFKIVAAVLGLVLVIVVLALLAYFVPGFLNFLIWCVEFPFKVIGKLSGEISQAVKRRREERERERRENGDSLKSGDKADGGRDRKNKKSDGGRDRKGD